MPILTWKDDYSVGVAQIDGEHQNLIEMINYAYDSIVEGKEQEVLADIVGDMKVYASEHFSTEEGLMRKYGYPESNEHKAVHDDFIIKAAVTDRMLANDQEANPTEVFKFLSEWLKNHIMVTDKKFAAFLNEQGVR